MLPSKPNDFPVLSSLFYAWFASYAAFPSTSAFTPFWEISVTSAPSKCQSPRVSRYCPHGEKSSAYTRTVGPLREAIRLPIPAVMSGSARSLANALPVSACQMGTTPVSGSEAAMYWLSLEKASWLPRSAGLGRSMRVMQLPLMNVPYLKSPVKVASGKPFAVGGKVKSRTHPAFCFPQMGGRHR